MKIVIIGCGVAGCTAAKKVRELDPRAEITVIDREGHGLYSRMRLPETLAGTLPEAKLILSSAEAIAAQGIQILSGVSAHSFDPSQKTVQLSNGDVLPYDKLILALGAEASLPQIEGAESSMTLRSLEDVKRFLSLAENAKSATVIGGGLLGLENAHSLHSRGIQVSIVEFMPRLLPKQLTEQESKVLQEKFTEAGYQLCLGRKTISIATEAGKVRVTLDDGTVLQSDMVMISAGIRPVTELAKAAGAVWPPDPYWEFSAFSVNELAPDKVILTSSHSPFSGATMRKEVQLLPGGRVALKTVLKNTGGKSVRWGLWSNTCIPGDAVVWVQPKAGRELRLEFSSWDPAEERPLGYEMSGDFIRFPSHSAQSTGTRSFGKMFLHPETPVIVARIGDVILVKKTLPISPEKVAPGHAPVEIFGMREQDTSSSFLELEFHGEYRELAPGQSVSFLEFWEVFPLIGREIDDRFLQEILLEAAVI